MIVDYTYKAVVVDVYDGDTITVDLDLGFGVWLRGQKLRLYGINTPEVRGPERAEGLVAKLKVEEIVQSSEECIVETLKDKTGKYGRWLAIVWLDGLNLNQHLLDLKLAKQY